MEADASPTTDQMSRRGFVGWAVGVGMGFIALVAAVPLKASVLTPSGAAKPGEFVKVAQVSALPVGQPFGLTFVQQTTDAYNAEQVPHSVFAVKKSDTEVTVFSPICPHLGCQVFFDRTSSEFVCPCHASLFSIDGRRTAGPSPRDLDTLPSKIEKGELYVQWVQYTPGTPQKTPV